MEEKPTSYCSRLCNELQCMHRRSFSAFSISGSFCEYIRASLDAKDDGNCVVSAADADDADCLLLSARFDQNSQDTSAHSRDAIARDLEQSARLILTRKTTHN